MMLQQWIEGCADYDVCEVEPEVIPEEIIPEEGPAEPVEVVYEEPEFEGRYYMWMGGPAMLMMAAGVSLLDKSYSELPWALATGWSFGISYFTFVWFHEFINGGPMEEDNIFPDYNLTAQLGYIGLVGLTGWGRYTDSTHPSTFVANCMSVLFGFMLTNRIKELNHPEPEPEEEEVIEEEMTEETIIEDKVIEASL